MLDTPLVSLYTPAQIRIYLVGAVSILNNRDLLNLLAEFPKSQVHADVGCFFHVGDAVTNFSSTFRQFVNKYMCACPGITVKVLFRIFSC